MKSCTDDVSGSTEIRVVFLTVLWFLGNKGEGA